MVEGFNNSEYARQYGLILTLDWLGQTTYEQGIENGSTVSSDNRVDIMFVNDRKFKLWATNGYMDDLSAYTSTSEYREEKLGNMWSSIYPRFRYNSNGNTSYEDDTLWGVPVDTSPTAIYYNRQAMENCGVIVISVDDDVVTQDNFAQFQGEYEGLTSDMMGEHLMDLWNENKIADKFGQWHDTCGNRGGVQIRQNGACHHHLQRRYIPVYARVYQSSRRAQFLRPRNSNYRKRHMGAAGGESNARYVVRL